MSRCVGGARVWACAAVLVGFTGAGRAEEAPKDILFFGNSFTQSAGGVEKIVHDLAVAAGHPEPYVRALAVGGKDLAYFAAGAAHAIDVWAPTDGVWDHVVMQEHSLRPTTHPTEGDPAAFRTSALALYQLMLDHSPGADATLFETWARPPGNSEVYPSIWPNAATMQHELWENYNLAKDDLNAAHGPGRADVAPVGEAFLAAHWNNLNADDLWHANTRGGFLAGLILYGTIYDDPTVSDLDVTAIAGALGLSAADAQELSAVADAALVPGPGAGALALVGCASLARRRRR